MAVATRLMDPLLASPTQKTPGRLVSSNSAGCPARSSAFEGTSFPVSRKPSSSAASWPSSHSVHGVAPMKTKRPRVS
jgi:hypothetical protein